MRRIARDKKNVRCKRNNKMIIPSYKLKRKPLATATAIVGIEQTDPSATQQANVWMRNDRRCGRLTADGQMGGRVRSALLQTRGPQTTRSRMGLNDHGGSWIRPSWMQCILTDRRPGCRCRVEASHLHIGLRKAARRWVQRR
jgi:hypothetical protein